MVGDDQGNDWLSTSRGLVSVRHEDLERAVDDPAQSLPRTRYADDAGSEGLSLNGGSMPPMIRAHDGRIWLATGQGAVVFDPDAVEVALASPPTVIERVLVDGDPRDADDPADLSADSGRIEFHYVGLSFFARDSLRYRYRLEGFDAQWVEAGGSTTVSYANLPPGDYVFEVQALVAGAVDAPHSAVHAFRIPPHLHQTPEFRAAVILLAGLLLVWWFRWRTYALRRRAEDLQVLVDERTKELKRRGDRLEEADRDKAVLISRLEVQSAQLARHAKEDGLTGLANRRELDRALQAALEDASGSDQPLAVALIDIDRFKRINDTFGHGVGDEVLRSVADRIRGLTEPPMTAGRYGGEEFALVLPNLRLQDARTLCERLRIVVEKEGLGAERPELNLSISIGVAEVVGSDPGEAYARADRLLYKAKRGGRNRVISGRA